jgi:hypothetical protein
VAGEVKWYLDKVLVKVDGATEKALGAIAHQIEGEAKVRARVDTGFMRNAVYVVEQEGDNYTQRRMEATLRADYDMAPRRELPDDVAAAVVAGADYSIYQEVQSPFLLPAAEAVAGYTAGVTAEAVYEEEIGSD